MEVLLAREVGAPRRAPVPAVVPGAEAQDSLRIGGGLEEIMASCRPGDLHRSVRGDAPVVGGVHDDRPLAVVLGDLDDGHPVRGLALADVVGVRRGSVPRPAIHDLEVRVLVVDREHAPAFCVVVQPHAVVVVPEGELLALAAAAGHVVELDRVGPHRLAPLGDDVPVVARSDGDRVEGVGGDRLEPEPVAARPRGGGPEDPRADHEGGSAEGDAGAEEASTRDLPLHQPAEVGLQRARVVDLVELFARELVHWSRF